jgi:hypothetical protein
MFPVNNLGVAAVNTVQRAQWAWLPREPLDYAWGAPPYAFPQGRQPRVIYYPAAPYYFPGFQTIYGFNGHFGTPAVTQYADPSVRLHRPPLGD